MTLEVCAREELEVVPPARKSYTVDWITVGQAIDAGAAEMFVRHWDELEGNIGDADLDIDWPRFFDLERAGWSRSFGLWHDGKLVGYSLFHVCPHIHARTKVQATNDVLYVEPEHRGGAGLRLVLVAETALRELGIWRITYHTKAETATRRGGKTTGDLLRKMGYTHDEEVFTKLL